MHKVNTFVQVPTDIWAEATTFHQAWSQQRQDLEFYSKLLFAYEIKKINKNYT